MQEKGGLFSGESAVRDDDAIDTRIVSGGAGGASDVKPLRQP
jgi:hypothetical protein